jgi:hypothetical protein
MTMKRFLRVIWLASVCLLLADVTYADSDGYYCVGQGFIAYQFGIAAPPVGPHRLYVVRFGGASGIEAPVVLALPQFQVHGILCREHQVLVSAYDAIYTVRLDSRNVPIDYQSAPWADHQNTPAVFVGQSLNLGAGAHAGSSGGLQRTIVGTRADGGHYLLEIDIQTTQAADCTRTVKTRLIRTDRNDRDVQQLEIFSGRTARGCERGD